MSEQLIRVGQVWESRDSRERGLLATVLEADTEALRFGNGVVTLQRFRKSRVRVSTLRSRYRLVSDPTEK